MATPVQAEGILIKQEISGADVTVLVSGITNVMKIPGPGIRDFANQTFVAEGINCSLY